MAKAKKVMVSMPADYSSGSTAVAERDSTRSAFLQEAARRELGRPDAVAVQGAVDRGRTALADVGSFESAELIRHERDARNRRR